jgi:aerobic carbon-monoxide dehydrogenase large subunit
MIAEPTVMQLGWTGQRVRRVEDRGMLTGATRYVTDVQLPRMLDIAFVRSPSDHARIISIDVDQARAVPGVSAVLTPDDLAEVRATVDVVHLKGWLKTPRPTLPADRVRYVGEPMVAVVAHDRYTAEDGAERVVVELEPFDDGRSLHEALESNEYFRDAAQFGEVEHAFAGADHVERRRLDIQRVVASAMETCGIVADYDAGSGELTCYMATQMPHPSRATLAEALGVPTNRVRVLCPAMGGAFGGKEVVLPEYLCAAYAAIRLGRPVRWIEDRAEALSAGAHAKEAEAVLEAAFDVEGRILGMRSRFVSDTGAYSSGIGAYVEFMVSARTVPGIYSLPTYAFEGSGIVTSKAPLSPFRGVGMTTSQTLREVLLDDAARHLGIDRMELRRRNIADDGPWDNVIGDNYESGSWRSAFERALELIDYDAFKMRQTQARAEGRLLGLGVSPFVQVAAIGSGGGLGDLPGGGHDSAMVTMDVAGTITVALPTFSHGQGHHTTIAQVIADMFGLEPSDIRVVDGDTSRTPFGMGTFGSRSGVFATGAARGAGKIVREKVLMVAAILLEAAVEDIELVGGRATIKGDPSSAVPLAQIARAAYFAPQVRAVLADPNLTGSAFFDPARPTHSNGTIAAVVEVDPETGGLVIERIVAVEDCGVKINPSIVDGQIRGGVAQGVGLAVLERQVYGHDGTPQAVTFSDYLIPRATDLPSIEIDHLETPFEHAPGGIKGMAEGPAFATPAALVCAIFDAIAPNGSEINALPLRPEVITTAIAAGVDPTRNSAAEP